MIDLEKHNWMVVRSPKGERNPENSIQATFLTKAEADKYVKYIPEVYKIDYNFRCIDLNKKVNLT